MTLFIHTYSNPSKIPHRKGYCNNFLEIKIVWNIDKIAWGDLIAYIVLAPFTHFGTHQTIFRETGNPGNNSSKIPIITIIETGGSFKSGIC